MILGPAGHWVHARESMRTNRLRRLFSAARLAWIRTFRESVRVGGAPALRRGYQAIFITPREEHLSVAAVDARDWASIVRLGWEWLTGDWVAAHAVTQACPRSLQLQGRRPVLALFDGEPQMLAPGAKIAGGLSRPQFISTRVGEA